VQLSVSSLPLPKQKVKEMLWRARGQQLTLHHHLWAALQEETISQVLTVLARCGRLRLLRRDGEDRHPRQSTWKQKLPSPGVAPSLLSISQRVVA
jgi:hypothetical protein